MSVVDFDKMIFYDKEKGKKNKVYDPEKVYKADKQLVKNLNSIIESESVTYKGREIPKEYKQEVLNHAKRARDYFQKQVDKYEKEHKIGKYAE